MGDKLRRILRSRTVRDAQTTAIVLAASAVILFAAGTLTAQWMVHQWVMSAQIGATLAGLYLFLAVPIAAAIGLRRLVRIVRTLRGH